MDYVIGSMVTHQPTISYLSLVVSPDIVFLSMIGKHASRRTTLLT